MPKPHAITVPPHIALCIRDAFQAVCVDIPHSNHARHHKFFGRKPRKQAMKMPAPILVAFRHDNIFEIRRISVFEIFEELPNGFSQCWKVTAVNLTIRESKSTEIGKAVAKDNVPNHPAGTAKALIQLEGMLGWLCPLLLPQNPATLEANDTETLFRTLGILVNPCIQKIISKPQCYAISARGVSEICYEVKCPHRCRASAPYGLPPMPSGTGAK